MAKAAKKKQAKRAKARANKYEEKLKVSATFEELVKQLVNIPAKDKK